MHVHKRNLLLEILEVSNKCVTFGCEAMTLLLSGTKLQWSSAITLAVFVWLFCAFWSAMPLIGWGEYDYEPLRTCCTLDYSKGDRCGLLHARSCSEKHRCDGLIGPFAARAPSQQELRLLLDPHGHLQHGHPSVCRHVILSVHR